MKYKIIFIFVVITFYKLSLNIPNILTFYQFYKELTMKNFQTKIVFSSFFVFLLWSPNSFAQNQNLLECGTGIIPLSPQELKQEKEYQKYKKNVNAKSSSIQQAGTILYVPFKFNGEEDPSITNMESVKTFFLENSYGIYTLSWDITPVIELDLTRQEYLDDISLYWANDLKIAWENLGYDRNQYDYLFMRSHVGEPFLTGALGNAGGTTIKAVTPSVGVASHEIGHALYHASNFQSSVLHHANLWIANNNQVIGPGTSQEYGNKFAIMGGIGLYDFGLPHKLNMDWIKTDEYNHVADNGTYRIYQHDRGTKQAGRKYGIKVSKVAHPQGTMHDLYYFVEYKSKRQGTHNGVMILTETQDKHTVLFDNHPGVNGNTGNNEGWMDAPLAVGETFRDDDAGITIENIASGGVAADAWMDVKITFDDPSSTDHFTYISFVTPSDGQTFSADTDIPVEISASDEDGISRVLLWQALFFPPALSDNTPPYNFTLNLSEGTYLLRTRAETPDGLSTEKAITIYVSNSLEVEEFNKSDFSVYPNPVKNNQINISLPEPILVNTIIIYDSIGKEVFTKKIESFENNILLNPSLSKGLYIIKINTSKNGQITKKIIVE